MNNRFWKEKYIGDYAFYCGFLPKNDLRFGISIGNENTSVDEIMFTFGFMKM